MQTLPLKAVPNQKMSSLLAGQQVAINLYLLADQHLYMDVFMNNAALVTGVICQNNHLIVRDAAASFNGDLLITDTQGSNDPTYDGLGTRYQLIYLTEAEVG